MAPVVGFSVGHHGLSTDTAPVAKHLTEQTKKKSTEETNQKQKVINIYGSQCLWRIRESKLAKVNTYRRCQIHHNSSELKIRLPTVA